MHPRALPVGSPAPSPRIGVEHELCLWRGAERVDFRRFIGTVAGGISPLDPGDPRARRLPSGVALTADGWEAELATPPLALEAPAPRRLDDLLRAERTELRDLSAPHGVDRVTGFSTHLNVSVPDERAVDLARTFLGTCLVALATVVEPATSHGLLVRPRRGRLEIGGEYVEGPDLVAGLTLLVACVRGLEAGEAPGRLSPPTTVASREKFGWFVPPEALREDGALERVWAWARPWAEREGLRPDPVDELVGGERPLRQLTSDDPGQCTFGGTAPEHPHAVDTRPRHLAHGLHAHTEWLTWQHVVWHFRDGHGHQCRAVVPVDQEARFLTQVDTGRLDPVLEKMMRPGTPRRRLLVHAQIGGGGLWHDVRPGALVPAERLPDGSVPRVSVRAARRAHLHEQLLEEAR